MDTNPEIKSNFGKIDLEVIDSILEKMSKEDAYYLALSIRYFIAKGVLYGSRITMISSLANRGLIDRYGVSNKEFEEARASLDNLVKKYELR